jgi:hypothetical protein
VGKAQRSGYLNQAAKLSYRGQKGRCHVSVVETALLRTAGSVVTPTVKRWLGRRRAQREREAPLIELIGSGIIDDLGVRRAERRLACAVPKLSHAP